MILLALGLTTLSGYSATYVGVDQVFDNLTTNTAANGGNDSGLNTFVATGPTGVGTSAMSVNYTYTMDLSLIGGTGTESINFSVDYTSTGTLGFTGGQVTITDGATAFIDSGESLSATINFNPGPSSVFTNITFGAFQAYGEGDASINSGATIATSNPVGAINNTSFTLENVDPGSDVFGIGFMTLNVVTADSVAVPEPSSTALLGLGGLAVLLRRRKM